MSPNKAHISIIYVKLLSHPRYLLLDEMIDSGLPFTTELNSLEAIFERRSTI